MGEEHANREYKDRLFNALFGREEHKNWTLDLYNAVSGKNYKDKNLIELNTIEGVVYMGMHNDVSFIIDCTVNIYEQQSTFNPNMPLRILMYLGKLYDKYVTSRKKNIYGSRQIQLPVPKLVTFYNGTREEPDEKILSLSDAFPKGSDPDVQVRVRMLNINYGRNKELMEKCRPLMEYAWLVREIRSNKEKGMDLDTAISMAIRKMDDDSLIKDFLLENESEVKDMLKKMH